MGKIKELKDRYVEWSKQPAGAMTKGDAVWMVALLVGELAAGAAVGYLTGYLDCLCTLLTAAAESEQE